MPSRVFLVSRFALLFVLAFASDHAAQSPQPVVGDRTSPLRPLASTGNVGVTNAVMRDQDDVRVLRVVVEPGGSRAMHTHDDVKFHMFVPITAPMTLTVEGAAPAQVPPWQPFYMKRGTQHAFANPGSAAVEILEIFIK
jgi:quercetin dioxygenase-like cupin family protein